MNQSTLETFLGPELTNNNQATQVLVSILQDFNVAWTDRNWYLHAQDLVYLDEKLADLLVTRKIARRIDLSQSTAPYPCKVRGRDTPEKEVI